MSDSRLYLTRASLRRDVPASALRALLVPRDPSARAGASHRAVWTLFGDRPDRARDFLWREVDGGVYYFLSRRLPVDQHSLFEMDDPKPFEPSFARGDRLQFSLRANATIARKSDPGQRRGKPCDVVMNALHGVPPGMRAEARHDAVGTAGTAWLASQGARCGFALVAEPNRVDHGGASGGVAVRATAYRTLRVDHAGPSARIGVLDLEGQIEVMHPEVLFGALASGFGRAKAFGCGLMLVRRLR